MFKKRKGIKLPYNKQGLIYFACMNEDAMSEEDRAKLKKLCEEVAGEEYADSLHELVSNETLNVHGVETRYHTSASRLYDRRRKFYYKIAKRIKIVITD
jgi:hypothetical protein